MRLAFGDQLRLEAAGAIARHRNPDLAILGQDRLRARPVPAVALAASGGIASLVAEMLGQLGAKRTLDQCLFELLEKTIGPRQILGLLIVSKQLIQQLRCNRRIGRHVSLLDKVNSQKPAYTFFLTPSSIAAAAVSEIAIGFSSAMALTTSMTIRLTRTSVTNSAGL